MADLYLHAALTEEVIQELSQEVIKKYALLGAQGPDPLYYNFLSKENHDYRYYADRMHDTNTQDLFLNMISYIKDHQDPIALSHLIGFICHYALDVKIHPYVYYNVGVYNKDDESTHKYKGLHLKFERSIDAVILQEKGIKPHRFPIHKKLFTVKHVPQEICDVFEYTLEHTYNKKGGGMMYQTGTKEMYKNIKNFVKDSFGIKRFLFTILDFFTDQDMYFKDISFYNHIEDYDFTNKQKRTWHHPVTNEPHNESVEELFQQAKEFAHYLIKNSLDYIKGNKSIDLTRVFTNLSFNSGVDCNHPQKMQYFSSYKE